MLLHNMCFCLLFFLFIHLLYSFHGSPHTPCLSIAPAFPTSLPPVSPLFHFGFYISINAPYSPNPNAILEMLRSSH